MSTIRMFVLMRPKYDMILKQRNQSYLTQIDIRRMRISLCVKHRSWNQFYNPSPPADTKSTISYFLRPTYIDRVPYFH